MRTPGTGGISTQGAKAPISEADLKVRNEVQIAFSQTLDLPGNTPNEKMLAWATTHAQKFAGLWENNHELRQKLIDTWATDREGCLKALRTAWNSAK